LPKREDIGVADSPTGDKCGAVFVDRDFKSWLQQKLGAQNFAKISEEKLATGGRLMKEFEEAKTAFSGDDQEFYISIPVDEGIPIIANDPTRNITEGEIRLEL